MHDRYLAALAKAEERAAKAKADADAAGKVVQKAEEHAQAHSPHTAARAISPVPAASGGDRDRDGAASEGQRSRASSVGEAAERSVGGGSGGGGGGGSGGTSLAARTESSAWSTTALRSSRHHSGGTEGRDGLREPTRDSERASAAAGVPPTPQEGSPNSHTGIPNLWGSVSLPDGFSLWSSSLTSFN